MSNLRPYVNPTPDIDLADFPQTVPPAGCKILDVSSDDDLYQVECRELTYVTRILSDGRPCPRKIYILIPSTKDPIQAVYGENGYPCIVFVQGSAWHKQNIYGHFTDHVWLAQRGFVVASVEYRESDLAPFPAQMQDVKTAIRFLRTHAHELHLDPNRVGLWGDSSGAHSALMSAFTSDGPATTMAEGEVIELDTPELGDEASHVRCVVDWFGPVALDQMNCVPSAQDHTLPQSPEGSLLGGRNVREHPEWVRAASPLSYIPDASERRLPPVLIMHGGRDQLVNFEQSTLLYEALSRAGQDVEFWQLPDAHHGTCGFRTLEALGVVHEFLKRHLQ